MTDAPRPWLSRGARDVILAAFFFSVMSALGKIAGHHVPTGQIVLARAFVTLVLSALAVWRKRISPWGNRKGLLTLRGLFGFGGLFCYFYAIARLPLADATVLHFTNPVLSAIGATIVLRERFGRGDLVAAIACMIGVVLVSRPSFLFGGGTALDPIAVGIALLGAFFAAAAYITVRTSRGSDDPVVIVLWFSVIAFPAAIPFAVREWVWPTPIEWLELAGVGVVTQIGQVLLTRSLHAETTARATTILYTQVLFSFGWGLAIFGETPTHWSVLGALAIAAGVFVAARSHATGSAMVEPK